MIRIGKGVAPTPEIDWDLPLSGKTALVTGASRGIGAAIAATLGRDGAKVVGLDVPQAENDLRAVVEALGGEALALDITADDAPDQIAAHFTAASTSSSTTPASPATARSRRCPKTAGRS